MTARREFIDHLPLSPNQRGELLNRMDSHAQRGTGVSTERTYDRRRETRWAYRIDEVALTIEHLGGGVSRLIACSRNLSATGIGFLHGGFLYPGSRCRIVLRTRTGDPVVVHGQVATARHIEGIVHEIGVRFDMRIDPSKFVDTSQNDDDAGDSLRASIDIPQLHGRVLLLESSSANAALINHYLEQTGLEITIVRTPGAAIDAIKRNIFDALLSDITLDGEDGVLAINKIRNLGFTGPIGLVTAEDDPARLNAAANAGAAERLAKPFSVEELFAFAKNVHDQLCGGALSRNSSMHEDASMVGLLGHFKDEALRTATLLESAVDEGNRRRVRSLCMQLKGSAGCFGYHGVSDAAEHALAELERTPVLADSVPAVRRVVLMCRSLGNNQWQAKAG